MSARFELPMTTAAPKPAVRDADWHRAARMAVVLSWLSLFYASVRRC